MEKQNILEILNSIAIVESDSDGESVIYAYVENSEENRKKLMSIELSESDISKAEYNHNSDGDVIDLTHFVWNYAEWFDGEKFLDYVPDDN